MYIPQLWFGSEESYNELISQVKAYTANPAAWDSRLQAELTRLRGYAENEDEEAEDYTELKARSMIQKEGSVGIVSIMGSLVPETSFWSLIFGGIGYDSIAAATNMLLEDEEVERVLYAVGSPGGAADGLKELSAYIRAAKQVKPITSWTGQGMLSAAYWIGAATDKIQMGELAEVGSIGAISTFTSYARALKEDGLDVYVSRSGKDKAPLHPAEEMNAKGKDYIDSRTKRMHQFFISNVLQNRPALASQPLDQWAEGGSFFYDDALKLGLADEGPVDIGQVIQSLNSMSTGDSSMAKKQHYVLTDAAKAAIQMGADPETVGAQVLESDEAAPAALNEAATGEIALEENAPAPETEAAPESVQANAGGTGDTLVTYLQGQLEKRDQRIETLLSEVNQHKAEATRLAGVEESLGPLVAEATNRMQVALGQAPTKLEGMSATVLAETYASTKAEFNDRFKVGRTSLEATEETRTPRDKGLDRLQLVSG
jgi:ClpP class serine protease